MAGIVKADYGQGLPGTRRHTLVPRDCPCIAAGNRPHCAEGSEQSNWMNLCPFWYGTRILHGGMVADLRTGQQLLHWLAFGEALSRSYEVLCLRKESASTVAGAHLRD